MRKKTLLSKIAIISASGNASHTRFKLPVFGFPGMLLGVPVFAVIYYLIKTFVEYALYKKRMPLETQKYIRADGYDIETEELIYSDNAAETRKERRERYGSYKNVSIERDKKREKQKANAAAEKDEQDE